MLKIAIAGVNTKDTEWIASLNKSYLEEVVGLKVEVYNRPFISTEHIVDAISQIPRLETQIKNIEAIASDTEVFISTYSIWWDIAQLRLAILDKRNETQMTERQRALLAHKLIVMEDLLEDDNWNDVLFKGPSGDDKNEQAIADQYRDIHQEVFFSEPIFLSASNYQAAEELQKIVVQQLVQS